MATPTDKIRCLMCEKEKATAKCAGCLRDFCFAHLFEHHQQMIKQLDELENKRNVFRQNLNEQKINPEKSLLIQQINEWEQNSISIIKETADQAKQLLLKYKNQQINEIEIKLMKLTDELILVREENDFNEVNLNEFKQQLEELEESEENLNKPSNFTIEQDSSSLINKISVIISSGD